MLKYRYLWLASAAAILVVTLLIVGFAARKTLVSLVPPPELAQIKALPSNVDAQSKLYLQLIKRVGPEKAQDLLWNSGLARTGNTHLLNHTVGDYLYATEGPGGIVKCRNYFSSSCYHGIVIDTVGDGGLDKMGVLMAACRQASFSAPQKCSHALGHGFVAVVGAQNLFKALDMCDSVGAQNITGFEASKCFVGAFMENIWGIHEGRPSPLRLVKATDEFYPCTDSRMQERYMNACWFNQAFQMNKVFGGNRPKVARECIKVSTVRYRDACLDGIFRSLASATADNIDDKFSQCGLMPPNFIDKCLTTNAQAAYQQGDTKTPILICQRMDLAVQDLCYQRLYRVMHEESSVAEQQKACHNAFPADRRDECLQAFKT